MLQTFTDHRPCSKAEFALTSFKLACQESTLLEVRMNINRLIYDRQLIDFYFPDIELDGIYKRQYNDSLSDDIVFIYGTKNIENYKVKLGYFGKMIALEAASLGFSTCWIGGTYNKICT